MVQKESFIAGCGFSFGGLGMQIAGIVTLSWYHINEIYPHEDSDMGLFKYCYEGTCISIDHPTSSLKAVRALEIIGASVNFVGLVLAVVFLVLLRMNKTTMKFHQFAFIAQSLSGLCSWIGAIVFSYDASDDTPYNMQTFDGKYYSYSFYFSIIGGIFAIFGGVFVAHAGKRLVASRRPPGYFTFY